LSCNFCVARILNLGFCILLRVILNYK
jgi:hypothetical protein